MEHRTDSSTPTARPTDREETLPARWLSAARREVALLGSTLRREWLIVSLLGAVSGWVTAANIGGNYVLHFIDILWPLNPLDYLSTLGSSWNPVNLGAFSAVNAFNIPLAVWLSGLQLLRIPIPIQEFVTLFGLQLCGGVYFYRLIARLLPNSSPSRVRYLALAASIAYISNYYVEVVYWWDNVPAAFLLLGFGPAFLFYLLSFSSRLLRSGSVGVRLWAQLSATSILAFSVNVPFNISLLALAIVVPVVAATITPLKKIRRQDWLRTYLYSGGTVLLTSLWWIVPDYLDSVLYPNYVGGQASVGYNTQLFQVTTAPLTFSTILRGFYNYGYPSYAHLSSVNAVYYNVAGVASILIPAGILIGLLLTRERKERALLLCGTIAILLLSLVVLGVNSPISPVLLWTLNSNSILLQAIRNPFISFGFALYVLLLILVVNSVEAIGSWLVRPPTDHPTRPTRGWNLATDLVREVRVQPRHSGIVAAGLVLLLLVLPFSSAAAALYAGDALPHSPWRARMQIPTYEYDVASYLSTHLGTSYALLYPGGFLEQNWTDGYDGYDILPSLLPSTLLIYDYGPGFVATPNQMLQFAYQSIGSGTTDLTNFSGLLQRLDVGYVVIEGQVGGSYPFGFQAPPEYSRILSSLNRTSGLELASTIGPDYLYRVAAPASLFASPTGWLPSSRILSDSMVPQLNLTQLYFNSTLLDTPLAPFREFYPTWTNGSIDFTLNESTKRALAKQQEPEPFSQIGLPVSYNGAPININGTWFDQIAISFETNPATAVTFSLVTVPVLQNQTSASLAQRTFYLGGKAANLGYGDSRLFSTYGADHFTSVNHSTLLVDDLRTTLAGSGTFEANYLVITFYPVTANGSGLRNVPIDGWPGDQNLRIDSIVLGNPYFAPSSLPPGPVSMTAPTPSPSLDLLDSYYQSASSESGSAPTHNFVPVLNAGAIVASANATVKAYIASHPLGPPFGGTWPPTVFNSAPIVIDPSRFSYLVLSFRTNLNAAFTASLVSAANLSNLNSSTLSGATHPMGGAGNSLGMGDPALFPTFGADHFYSPNGSVTMVQSLDNLLRAANGTPQTAEYLLLSLFPVADNGTGIRFLPVSQWPGDQILTISQLSLEPYLLEGSSGPIPAGFFSPASQIRPPGAPMAGGYLPLVNGTIGFPVAGFAVTYTVQSPTDYQVVLTRASPTTHAALLVFRQNYADGWTASGIGLTSIEHLKVDGALNGFLLVPDSNRTQLVVEITFSPQHQYVQALVLGFGAALLPTLAGGFGPGLAGWIRVSRKGSPSRGS